MSNHHASPGATDLRRRRNGSQAFSLLAIALFMAAPPTAVLGQIPGGAAAVEPDTTRVVELEAVVVTAERSSTPLVATTSAVTRLSADDLRGRPVLNLADALQQVPGLAFLDLTGMGEDPQLTVRGFYGGGEAEYVVVMLDGVPLNGFEAGLINWDLVPVTAVETIEVVRGGASSLYGDAAIGGVINLITRGTGGASTRLGITGGQYGQIRGSAAVRRNVGGRAVSLFGAMNQTDGFRDHAGRTNGSVGGSVPLADGAAGSLHLSTLHHWRSFDEPGPLAGARVEQGARVESSPFYRFDDTRERLHRVALDGRHALRQGIAASGYVAGELRAMEETRTLALSPDFADTKLRDLSNSRLLGSFQIEVDDPATAWADRLLVGTDWSAGRLATEHQAVLSGDEDAYRASGSPSPEVDARGTASRFGAAAFARYDVLPVEALRLSIGGRVDWLRDDFLPRAPSEGERLEAEHLAFSPKVGLNFRYLRSERQEGHVFASAGQSFKAPTPDQLFDQRSIPVPFPPFAITISNELLRPQYGTGFEAGLYHGAELLQDGLSADLSLSAYQIDMRDELDFSFEEFRYVNIGRSRHRGIESGLRLRGANGVSAFAGYTLQSVTARAGEHIGRFVKAVPRHVFSGDVRARHRLGLEGSVGVLHADGIYLDDANSLELPAFTRVDARAALPLGRMQLAAQVFNVFDSEYSTTGYPDPSGSGAVYYYPAAGRVLQVGLTTSW